MRAFRTSTTTEDRDEETGEPFTVSNPVLVVQFNSLEQHASYLMPNEQVADCLATIITQLGNRPHELHRFAEIMAKAALNSAGEEAR
jgi:hypothetical protein